MSPESRPIHDLSRALMILAVALSCFGCRQPTKWTPRPSYASATGTNDFDLTWSDTDPNGSPANPHWAPQGQTGAPLPPTPDSQCTKSNSQPYQSGCTSQSKYVVQDTGGGLNGLLCSIFGAGSPSITGHADWTVASAEGTIGWLNYADDFDYNLFLLPNNNSGLTKKNNSLTGSAQKYIEVEFDSRELEGRFATNWWKTFAKTANDAAASGDFSQISEYLHPNSDALACGTVYGVFGIDCEHGCRSEYHPAYAVAIQTDESKGKNTWAIFARNWGDEGFCSRFNHELVLDSVDGVLRLLLPYSSDAAPTGIKILESAGPAGSQCPRFRFQRGKGEVIEIPLRPPGTQGDAGLTEVVVEMNWPDSAAPVACNNVPKANMMRMLTARRAELGTQKPEETSEEHFGRLFRSFNQANNQTKGFPEMNFKKEVLEPFAAKQPARLTTMSSKAAESAPVPNCTVPETNVRAEFVAPAPAAPPGKPAKMSQHNLKKSWDQATVAKFCAAYEAAGKKLPPGEPADLAQKLDKVCSDKTLK